MSGFNSQKHGIIFPIVVVQSVIAITMQFFIVYAYLRFSDLRKVRGARGVSTKGPTVLPKFTNGGPFLNSGPSSTYLCSL